MAITRDVWEGKVTMFNLNLVACSNGFIVMCDPCCHNLSLGLATKARACKVAG
jgi:hypothetical protein